MIIYNVTTKVEHSVAESWLTWLQEEHIPDIIATGCYTHAVILHLIEADDKDGVTYAVQYHTANKDHYDRYIEHFADEMRRKAMSKWGDKFISYRTLMKVVN